MSKKLHVLTTEEARKVKEMYTWFTRIKNMLPLQRRRNPRLLAVRTLHKAYCKDDAGSGNTIDCYLDSDGDGDVISVTCEICGGSDLNNAIPYLTDGKIIWVVYDNGIWKHLGKPFQALGDGLKIDSGVLKAAIDTDKGLEFDSGNIAIKINTEQLAFNESGNLETNLYECT